MATDLRSRIAAAGGQQPRPVNLYHPTASVPGGMVAPMTATIVTADAVQVAQCTPLYTDPNGAPVPATAPGRWVQVHAAGRP